MDLFLRADSTNLPKLNNLMILEYLSSTDKHNVAEIRGAKALMSSRESYIDSAVGYVEVKRSQLECIVRAKIVPEHKVSVKQYIVSVTINEKDDEILNATCDGCAASAGGCKHALVFLFWLEKRSSEPATTSTQCYWKKPKLSGVRFNPIRCEEIFKKTKTVNLAPKNPDVLAKFLDTCNTKNVSKSLALCFHTPKTSYNIFDLTVEFLSNQPEDYEKYICFLGQKITPDIIKDINLKTMNQVSSKLWHSMRQGRITASKVYEASMCKVDGTLVQQILGGYKVPETEYIKRGKKLEQRVIEEAQKKLNKQIEKSGLLLINGVVGASPDGVGDDFVIEVKCPSSEKTLKTYVDKAVIKNKYKAQIQTQMVAAKINKAVFCVADPKFEENQQIFIYWMDYDAQYTNDLLSRAMAFWKTYIYKKIVMSARI